MTIKEKMQKWADEINLEWTGYTAKATDENVVVSDGSRIDYNNGRYTVTSNDDDVKAQLEWMTER